MAKLSKRQQELLALLREGWEAVIYHDDLRTRYLPPDRTAGAGLRGKSQVVEALLRRGLIVVAKVERHPHHIDRMEAVTYRAADKTDRDTEGGAS